MKLSSEAKQEAFHAVSPWMWAESSTQAHHLREKTPTGVSVNAPSM